MHTIKARLLALLVVLALVIPLLGAPAKAATVYKPASITQGCLAFIPGQKSKVWKCRKGDKVKANRKVVYHAFKSGKRVKCYPCAYRITATSAFYVDVPVYAVRFK